MSLELLFLNIGFIAVGVMNIVLGVLVLFRGVNTTVKVTYFLTTFSVAVYIIGFLLGVNISDPYLSRIWLSVTMVTMLAVCFSAHWIFATLGLAKKKIKGVILMYAGAVALIVFYATDLDRFSLLPVSKLYFPNYFVAGKYYWVLIAFFSVVVVYSMSTLFAAYMKADPVEKNRMKYYIGAFVFGYPLGALAFFLAYNIPIDPIFSMMLGLYTVPLAYGILKYNLMDIHIIAKRAFMYASITALLSGLINSISLTNAYLTSEFPNFPFWFMPLLASVVSVGIGAFVWQKIREVDVLKYEFINNVTHKFRTPLTHIRWLSEDLRKSVTQDERDKAVEQIQYSSMRLFELTNILIDVAHDDNNDYLYRFTKGDLGLVISNMFKNHKVQITEKKLTMTVDIAPELPQVVFDERRLSFAIQILFENSLIYTPKGGTIKMRLTRDGNNLLFNIEDNGIGIPTEELPFLFSKFYRAQNARRTDTEGMGIGLFMSKSIIEKHNGKVWAESAGVNKGSKFFFTLPIT